MLGHGFGSERTSPDPDKVYLEGLCPRDKPSRLGPGRKITVSDFYFCPFQNELF